MKKYMDLTREQQTLFVALENVFMRFKQATIRDFVTTLGVLINKYKKRSAL